MTNDQLMRRGKYHAGMNYMQVRLADAYAAGLRAEAAGMSDEKVKEIFGPQPSEAEIVARNEAEELAVREEHG